MKLRYFLLILTFLIFIPSIFSQPYYADLKIDVDETGDSRIEGLSNIPSLETPLETSELTSKKGKFWTFNLTTQESIDSFVFELTLPENANINYIKTTPNFRIEDNNGRITLIGSGENKHMQIIVQYKIEDRLSSNNSDIPFIALFVFFVILGAIVGGLLKRFIFKDKKSKTIPGRVFEEESNYEFLSKRQREIIEIIKNKDKITQKELEALVSIPKSSLSRNLKTLEIKGFIEKKQVGQTKYIILK